jgi:plastocyanin
LVKSSFINISFQHRFGGVLMKKIIIVGFTLLIMIAMMACSANNTSEESPVADDGVEVTVEHNSGHEEPAVDTKEEPKAEEPTAEEPKEEPKAEEPKAEEPKAEEPIAVEPKEEPAAVEPAPVATPKTHRVEIVDFAFSPATLEIHAGDTVEFINLDAVKHSAVEDHGVFDTGLLAKDQLKKVTFGKAGEFGYYCGPHPGMRASIIVK